MHTRWISVVFGLAAMAMMVLSLWLWQYAPAAAMEYRVAERSVFTLGARCAAVALAAAAQWVIVASVIGAIYPRNLFDRWVCRASALVSGVACVAAIALGLAGK